MQNLPEILPPQLPSGLNVKSSNSLQRTGWITNRISRLISAYRRDDYTDAESFIAQAGVVLEGYPDDVIEHITAPQTGIQRTQKFAPTIAEITQACEARVAEIEKQKELDAWARKKRESDEIKSRSQRASQAPRTANLFVPEGQPRYEKMVDKHNADPSRGSYFEARVCHDGIKRNGLWVPLDWWEEPLGAKQERKSDGPVVVSEHLKALLRRQLGEESAA